MSTLILINALVCAVICLRVVFYRKRGSTHRPLASGLAYLVVIASGSVTLMAVLGKAQEPTIAEIVLHAVLCLALLASRGNVVSLFQTTEADNLIYRLIRRTRNA